MLIFITHSNTFYVPEELSPSLINHIFGCSKRLSDVAVKISQLHVISLIFQMKQNGLVKCKCHDKTDT